MSDIEVRADRPSEVQRPAETTAPEARPAADAAREEGLYGERFDASLPRREAPPMDPGAARLAASLAAAETSPVAMSPGARRHQALDVLFNRLAERGASPHGHNPNNPDFPDDALTRRGWERQVGDRFRLGNYAAFGSSMGDVTPQMLRSLVGAQVDRIYPRASPEAREHAVDHVSQQLLEQRSRWQREGAREVTPSWLEPPASEPRPDPALPEIQASAPGDPLIPPEVSQVTRALGVASRVLKGITVPTGAIAAATGPLAAGSFMLSGLMEIGRLNQETEFNQERVSEKEGLVLGMSEAVAQLGADGSLPTLDELQDRSRDYLVNNVSGGGTSDPDAFRRGVEASFAMLNELTPEGRLELRDDLGRLQTEALGRAGGTSVHDYEPVMRYLLGVGGE